MLWRRTASTAALCRWRKPWGVWPRNRESLLIRKVVDVLQKRYRQLEKRVHAQFAKEREEETPLSTDMKIQRGLAPAAGFEDATVKDAPGRETTFLSSIAAARQEAQALFELSQDLGRLTQFGRDALSVFREAEIAGAL